MSDGCGVPAPPGAQEALANRDSRRQAVRSLRVTVVLTAIVGIGALSIDMFLPSLPSIGRQFGSGAAAVQRNVTLFMLAYAAAQLGFGPLSDRFGRRPLLLTGLGLYLCGGVLCLLAPSIEVLIAARILQGIGAGSGPVIGRAIVRDLYPRERAARVFAAMGTAQALTPVLAPILGGYVHEWFGWRAVFAILAAFGLLFLAASAMVIRESAPPPDGASLRPARLAGTVGTMLRHPGFLGYVLTATLSFGGQFVFISSSAFVLIGWFRLSPDLYGYSFGFVACGILAGNALSARYTLRLGIGRVIFVGACVAAASGATMAALTLAGWGGAAGVLAPMVCYALSVGLVMPNAMAGAIVPFPHAAGLASAVTGFLMLAGSALYSIAVSAFYDGTPLPMAGAIALSGVAALAGCLLLLRPGR